MWDLIIGQLKDYGPAALICGVLLFIFYKILNGFMSGLKEDRENYMKIISSQQTTQNNHIAHLEEAVGTQSRLMAQQGEKFTSGIDQLCRALDSQTALIKEYIKNNK